MSIGDNYYLFKFNALTPYQAVSRTTATCYYKATQLSEKFLDLGCIADQYEHQGRASCTDGDKAFARSERAHAAAHESILQCRTTCCVHYLANARKGSLSHDEGTFSRVKHVVLALRAPNGMKTFRRSLRRVILQRLRIVRDRRPSSTLRWRNAGILENLLQASPRVAIKRRIIFGLLGACDWSQSEHLDIFLTRDGATPMLLDFVVTRS